MVLQVYAKILFTNEKLCNYYCKFAKLKKPENEKITESDMLETIQSNHKKVWTFYTNLIWILKREVSNKVFDLINYIESTFYKTTKYILLKSIHQNGYFLFM